MEIVRIPRTYSTQIQYLSDKDMSYIFKNLFLLSEGEVIDVEDSMRGGLLKSIWREVVQMENKARAKKGEKRLCYELATLRVDTESNLEGSKSATKSKQVNTNQNNSIIISKDIKAEPIEYGNKQINEILAFLCKAVGVDQFKESQRIQRQYGKHFMSFIEKNGKEDFIGRVKGIISDDFKLKNCNSLKFLYAEVKAYIHTPLSDNGVKKC